MNDVQVSNKGVTDIRRKNDRVIIYWDFQDHIFKVATIDVYEVK